MAGVIADKVAWPILKELADGLCAELNRSNLPEPCFCGVLPGSEVSLAHCDICGDKCGMAWTRLVNLQPVEQAGPITAGCQAPLSLLVEVGIARCASTVDDDGAPPTIQVMEAETQLQLADMSAMRRAICKTLKGHIYALNGYAPMGPMGGCVGGAWSLLIEED